MSKFSTRKKIKLVLGWQPIEIGALNPNTTILQYLRNDMRLAGTKEGCAEGDCGACTVIVGQIENGKIRYSAVNSCILLVPYLDGKQILTIEHISAKGLHPVQSAMVDLHASQCGFCTPGIVMSLISHYLNRGGRSRHEIDITLAGNLCRCTGYGPIIETAKQITNYKNPAWWGKAQGRVKSQLIKWQNDNKALILDHGYFKFFLPLNLKQLIYFLNEYPESMIIAGMTDIGLLITKKGKQLTPLLSLLGVKGLDSIKIKKNFIEIGAAVTYGDAIKFLTKMSPSLGELLRRIGSKQIRNTGTICGNIANGSPIGDMPPPLIALGTSVVLRSANGRRKLDLEDFFVDYNKQNIIQGEFIEKIQVPWVDGIFRCYKVSKRFEQDISAVAAGFQIKIKGKKVVSARIVFGGMAAIPKRAKHCEAAIIGSPWEKYTIGKARRALLRDFSPISDARASEKYRTLVAGNLVEKFFIETTTKGGLFQLADRRLFEEERNA